MLLQLSIRALFRIIRVLKLKLKNWTGSSANALLAMLRLFFRRLRPSGDRQPQDEAKGGFETAPPSTCALVPYQPGRHGSPINVVPSELPSELPYFSVHFGTSAVDLSPTLSGSIATRSPSPLSATVSYIPDIVPSLSRSSSPALCPCPELPPKRILRGIHAGEFRRREGGNVWHVLSARALCRVSHSQTLGRVHRPVNS
jgi:hypothetical protein